ncbi:MAG: peptide chain release factor N(5)-glutamine methyltransferase [Burkholderiales bacterium]|nr:peptide chain release factor N(5)-glutamine methyltransferase [Burkholderiales bacterium]
MGAALRAARSRLVQALGLDPSVAGLEAQMLLGHVLARPRAYLLAHPEAALTDADQAQFDTLLTRREHGEPIAYILGEREFFGLTLRVTPEVLIPRPDTELLVALALTLIPEGTTWEVLDLGTGSGAVAIAIAKQRPKAHVIAIDQSGEALVVARDNAHRHGATNLQFLQGDWFAPLGMGARFDVIVGNPPYIAEGDAHLFQGDLRFEPKAALASGAEGLDAIRAIASKAAQHMTPSGWLLLEHGFEQGAACRKILAEQDFQGIYSHCDLAGHERVTAGRLVGTQP